MGVRTGNGRDGEKANVTKSYKGQVMWRAMIACFLKGHPTWKKKTWHLLLYRLCNMK